MAKILIVEDNAETLDSLTIWLELGDHTVVVARDGDEALALLPREQPELVITDGCLPGVSGVDLVKSIRVCLSSLRDVPIIMITGYYAKFADEALSAGANCVLPKPANPEILAARVRTLLSGDSAAVPAQD